MNGLKLALNYLTKKENKGIELIAIESTKQVGKAFMDTLHILKIKDFKLLLVAYPDMLHRDTPQLKRIWSNNSDFMVDLRNTQIVEYDLGIRPSKYGIKSQKVEYKGVVIDNARYFEKICRACLQALPSVSKAYDVHAIGNEYADIVVKMKNGRKVRIECKSEYRPFLTDDKNEILNYREDTAPR